MAASPPGRATLPHPSSFAVARERLSELRSSGEGIGQPLRLGMPLVAEVDKFHGVTVSPESIPREPGAFAEELEAALVQWRNEGYRLAWLELPISLSALIPLATAQGFVFHHCQTDSVMMTRRLSQDSFVPPFASHYLGAGGVVISADGELLTVMERYGPARYKLPGGLIEVGENIAEGVRREVREETGVETEFDELIAVGHAPRWIFGRASLYLVCTLRPSSRNIVRQASEIAEALWMPIDEFMASERASQFTKDILELALGREGMEVSRYASPISKSDWVLFLPGPRP